MNRRHVGWMLGLLLVLASGLAACEVPEGGVRIPRADGASLCAVQSAVTALDESLAAVAALDAAAVATPDSPEQAAALDALDQAGDDLAEVQEVLATTPSGDRPEIRAALVELVDQAVAIVDDLTARIEAGDVAGIEAAIASAGALRGLTGSILATIAATGVTCPIPSPGEPTPDADAGGDRRATGGDPNAGGDANTRAISLADAGGDSDANARADPEPKPDRRSPSPTPDAEPDTDRQARHRPPTPSPTPSPTPTPSATQPDADPEPHAKPDAEPEPSPSPSPTPSPTPSPSPSPSPSPTPSPSPSPTPSPTQAPAPLATATPIPPEPAPAGLSTVALIGLLVLAIGGLAAVGAFLWNATSPNVGRRTRRRHDRQATSRQPTGRPPPDRGRTRGDAGALPRERRRRGWSGSNGSSIAIVRSRRGLRSARLDVLVEVEQVRRVVGGA